MLSAFSSEDGRSRARYLARERAKRDAWRIVHSDASLDDRCSALLRVIEAHYDRSLEAAENFGTDHPNFETYVPHWLSANGTLAPDVAAKLGERYPLETAPRLDHGRTYW